ncbi:MAG: HAMP domain-containing histidine kinase [Firmicutes bacterium]|nr:HAMP domain-containing histidine kinase [Bacillota bacterium]
MRLLFSYMKSHRKSICLFAAMFAAYGALLYLFDVPAMVPIYCTLVILGLGTFLVSVDFGRYQRRHKELLHMEKEIVDAMDHLPLPQDLIEEDYQAIIRASFQDRMDRAYEADRKRLDMTDYYTMWAHQIKTPIAAMKLLLQTGEIQSQERKELENELFRIEQYVEMALCYTRLDEDSNDYVLKEYELSDIIKQAVRKFASQFIRSKCLLVYEEEPCKVMTDEKWLLFVIEQVLSNSLKYTRQGQIEIMVKQPKTLVIRDSGMGIAPEDLPRIFEKGYTGYNGREDKKSTGLGLYLCRRILENLGHKITASSVVGEGTEISIDLNSYDFQGE